MAANIINKLQNKMYPMSQLVSFWGLLSEARLIGHLHVSWAPYPSPK